jgi:hypothetical protein
MLGIFIFTVEGETNSYLLFTEPVKQNYQGQNQKNEFRLHVSLYGLFYFSNWVGKNRFYLKMLSFFL